MTLKENDVFRSNEVFKRIPVHLIVLLTRISQTEPLFVYLFLQQFGCLCAAEPAAASSYSAHAPPTAHKPRPPRLH